MILGLDDAECYRDKHPGARVEYIGDGYFKVKDTMEQDKKDAHDYYLLDRGQGIPAAVKGYVEEDKIYGLKIEDDKLVIEEVDKTLKEFDFDSS